MPIERGDKKEMSGEERELMGETALIPKSMLMGKSVSPGDRVILEVGHVFEDEVEVFYPKGEKKKEPMEEANDDLESRATPDNYGSM